MPDIFVPIDTTTYSNYYRDLVAKGAINRVCTDYIDSHREMLKKEYRTEDSFIDNFKVSDSLIEQLKAVGEKEGVKFNAEQFAVSEPTIRRILKALIARDLFEQSSYYRVANEGNPVYREALRIINEPKEYAKILGK